VTFKVLIAPQEFKGTLTAIEAAAAMEEGVLQAAPDAEVTTVPIADGGPGTVDAFLAANPDGEVHHTDVEDPLGRPVTARWATFHDRELAVIEMAAASGLSLLLPDERKPLEAHTFGTGQLVKAALDLGCQRVLVGAGGSATSDAGFGACQALGIRFLDKLGRQLGREPANIARLNEVVLIHRDGRLGHVELIVLSDCDNPLLGEKGAARVYSPNKGADEATIEKLESLFEHLVLITGQQLSVTMANRTGAGAAGGLAWGLATFCAASIRRGFDVVAEALALSTLIADANFVLTGEGRLDPETQFFKGPWGVGRMARMQKKRSVLFAGSSTVTTQSVRDAFDQVISIGRGDVPDRGEARERLVRATRDWARTAARGA
jgi:glycerate 2-kinase